MLIRSSILILLLVLPLLLGLWGLERYASPETLRRVDRLVGDTCLYLDSISLVALGRVEDRIDEVRENLVGAPQLSFEGDYQVSKAELRESVQRVTDRGLLAFSPELIKQGVEGLAWVDEARVSLGLFPTRVHVALQESVPWLVAELESGSWLVSSARNLIEPLAEIRDPQLIFEVSSLPRIEGLSVIGDGEIESGEPDTFLTSTNSRLEYVLDSVYLLEMAEALPFPIELYKLLSDGSLRLRPHGAEADLLLKINSLKDATRVKKRLKLVLKDLEVRDEKPRELDLRFENQVIIR